MRPSGLLRRVSSSGSQQHNQPASNTVEPFAAHSPATNNATNRSNSPTKSHQPGAEVDSPIAAHASGSAYTPSRLVRTPELDACTDETSPTLVDSSSGSSSADEGEGGSNLDDKAGHDRPTRARDRLAPPAASRPQLGVFGASSSPSSARASLRPSLAATKLHDFGGSSTELLRGWAMRSSGAPLESPALSDNEKATSDAGSAHSGAGRASWKYSKHSRTGSASLQQADLRRLIGRTRRWRASLTSCRSLAVIVIIVLLTSIGWSSGRASQDELDAHFSTARTWFAQVGLPWQVGGGGEGGLAGGAVKVVTKTTTSTSTSKAKPKRKPKPENPLALNSTPRRIKYGANLIEKLGPDSDEPEEDNRLLKKLKTAAQRSKMFREAKKEYFDEADYWKEWWWAKPQAHESLQAVVVSLSAEEQTLRSWIYDMRTNPKPASRPVGLVEPGSVLWDVTITPSMATGPPIQPSDDEREPVSAAPPPSFPGGNVDKWSRLLEEADTTHGGVCQGSTWLDSYREMHAEMLSGQREPKLISYHCEKGMNCGGLGDRLLGMTSAFFFGLITNRAFLAEWQTPVPLDVVFDSAGEIDWSFSTFASETAHPVLANRTLLKQQADLDVVHFNKDFMDKTFDKVDWDPPRSSKPALTKGMELRDLAFNSPWIRFFSNRGMVYKSFSYSQLEERIVELGLKPMTAFSCILEYLFRPKPPVAELIAEYSSVLSLPSVFSVGVQVRTGDMSMRDPLYDLRHNTVSAHRDFFECADQLAETYAQPGQRIVYFLVTDSAALRESAREAYGERVVISGAEIEHIHVRDGHANGVHNAVLEEWILARTDYRVITEQSGFGKLASFASGQKASTVAIVADGNPDVMSKGWKKPPKVDCRLEGAFTTFDRLSSVWSLG